MSFIHKDSFIFICVFLFGMVIFSQGLGLHGVEYRDDEIFYYKSTREMVAQNNHYSPTYFGKDRFQKPILFYWLVILSYEIFGISWFAARFVSVFFASMTLGLTWMLAKQLFDKRTAFLSTVILMTVPLFFRHARNAVPDMAMNFFIVLSIYAAIQFFRDTTKKEYPYLFFTSCALGFMIKGFTAVIVPFSMVVILAFSTKRTRILKEFNFLQGLLIIAAMTVPWFLYMWNLHGDQYLKLLLVQETQKRLLDTYSGNNFFIKIFATGGKNALFYLRVLLTNFAPWSIFVFIGIPYAFINKKRVDRADQEWRWMFIWLATVFVFFSLVHVKISHYLLALSTPFAIVVADYLCNTARQTRWLHNFSQGLVIFLYIVSIAALSFFQVVWVQADPLWLAGYVLVGFMMILAIIKSKDPMLAPLFLAFVVIFMQSQAKIMARAGVTTHSTWQRLSHAISEQLRPDTVIGVASHDLHEKELQIYFDKRIEKTGHSHEPLARVNLNKLLQTQEDVIYFVTEDDYAKFLPEFKKYSFDVVQQDYIFRKRLRLDKGFCKAIVGLDRETIHDYLMEKVFVLKKAGDDDS